MNDIPIEPGYLAEKPIDIDHLLTLFTAIKEKKTIEWRPREKPDAWCEAPNPPSRRLLNIIINNPECFRVARKVREFYLVWNADWAKWVSAADGATHYTGETIHVREVL